jgi:EAL domain-containing protein (putative c-di-GMP-specific phosphodiesterase class I)
MLVAISALLADANKRRLKTAYYDESVIVSRQKETQYASEISAALQNREFEIYLQPKIDLQSGRICGAEALIRWNHPEDGFLPPGVFLETVEKSNHRAEFAIFVAEETMRLCQEVHALGHEIAFSFNLSGYDIVDPIVLSKLKALAAMFEGHRCRPEIELTEAETSLNVVEIKESLNQLAQLGYRIALDDFGTGMSSLSYCHELSINTVKIDKSFVDVLLKDAIGVIPIASILSLAECYGYDVVVEGVETEDQAAVLSNMGCTLCQGYYFAKPMPFSEFLAFINGKSLGMIA